MTNALQWTPGLIVDNLSSQKGNKTKAVSEFKKLSADYMAVVLAGIRGSADPKTLEDLTNLLRNRVLVPGAPKHEAQRFNNLLAILENNSLGTSEPTSANVFSISIEDNS